MTRQATSGRPWERVASQRGDHKGESDDRMLYLRQAGASFRTSTRTEIGA
jgi:hypothetical protein